MSNLKIENIAIGEILPYAKNAKNHPEKQIQQLARSIKQFGFTTPLLLDEENVIISGHGRYKSALLLGMETVPCIHITGLTESKKRALRIAENKISENGEWDLETLKVELKELEIICDDFDITDTGFTTLEIDSMFSEKPDKEKIDEKGNYIPFVPDNEIVSKFGDVWQIGKHRLICGDSLHEETYKKLMGDKRADQVLTDQPYNLSASTIGNSGKIKHENLAGASGEKTSEEFKKFLTDSMILCAKYSMPTALGYYWMDWRHIEEIMSAGRASYPLFVNLCVWQKAAGGLGKLYRSAHELCFVFGKDKHYLDNVELGKNGRYRINCWNYAGVNSFGPHKGDLKYHPTTKAYEMFKDAILDCTPRGGIVLDAFLGSGTTLIAAEKSKRICYAIEYEPKYVDTAIRRFKELFGIDAIRESDGKTYSELLSEKLSTKEVA